MKRKLVFLLYFPVFLFLVHSSAFSMEWRFPVNLSYVDGARNVFNHYKNTLEAEGWTLTSEFYLPVAVSFHPFIQFNSGLRLGVGFGPMTFVYISGPDYTHFEIPLNVNGGFTFAPNSNTSPYVKGGVVYHIATGDLTKGSTPGVFGSFGIEFMRMRMISFGVEATYDFSTLKLEKTTTEDYYDPVYNYYYPMTVTKDVSVKSGGLIIGLFVMF